MDQKSFTIHFVIGAAILIVILTILYKEFNNG
jgi:hypothetical protein